MAAADTPDAKGLFEFDGADSCRWVAVNDTVMGGRSRGTPLMQDGVMEFTGVLSLENNGGFASVRCMSDLDLSGRQGIRLRVKGDGRRYELRLQTDARFRGRPVSFAGTFETRAGEWTEVAVPFEGLKQSFRGRKLAGYPFDPARIQMLGVLLADKNPGPFSIEVARIEAY